MIFFSNIFNIFIPNSPFGKKEKQVVIVGLNNYDIGFDLDYVSDRYKC